MDIEKSIMDGFLKAQEDIKNVFPLTFEEVKNEIMKAKRAQIGEVREWGGVKMQKTANGWAPVKGGEESKAPEDQPGEKEPGVPEEGKSDAPNDISEHAKKASEAALQNAIKNSPDPDVRAAAHKELQRRTTEEKSEMFKKPEGGGEEPAAPKTEVKSEPKAEEPAKQKVEPKPEPKKEEPTKEGKKSENFEKSLSEDRHTTYQFIEGQNTLLQKSHINEFILSDSFGVSKTGLELKQRFEEQLKMELDEIRENSQKAAKLLTEIGSVPDCSFEDEYYYMIDGYEDKIQNLPMVFGRSNDSTDLADNRWEYNSLARKIVDGMIEILHLNTLLNTIVDGKQYKLTVKQASILGY